MARKRNQSHERITQFDHQQRRRAAWPRPRLGSPSSATTSPMPASPAIRRETQDVSTLEVDGQSYGVQTGVVSTSINAALLASSFSLASSVGAATVQSQVLTAINDTQGTPGGGTSLADAVSALQSSFTTLQADPSSQAQQTAVVSAANTLASTINTTASTITAQETAFRARS